MRSKVSHPESLELAVVMKKKKKKRKNDNSGYFWLRYIYLIISMNVLELDK